MMKPAFGTQNNDESYKESYRGCWTAGEKGMASSRPSGHTTTGRVTPGRTACARAQAHGCGWLGRDEGGEKPLLHPKRVAGERNRRWEGEACSTLKARAVARGKRIWDLGRKASV